MASMSFKPVKVMAELATILDWSDCDPVSSAKIIELFGRVCLSATTAATATPEQSQSVAAGPGGKYVPPPWPPGGGPRKDGWELDEEQQKIADEVHRFEDMDRLKSERDDLAQRVQELTEQVDRLTTVCLKSDDEDSDDDDSDDDDFSPVPRCRREAAEWAKNTDAYGKPLPSEDDDDVDLTSSDKVFRRKTAADVRHLHIVARQQIEEALDRQTAAQGEARTAKEGLAELRDVQNASTKTIADLQREVDDLKSELQQVRHTDAPTHSSKSEEDSSPPRRGGYVPPFVGYVDYNSPRALSEWQEREEERRRWSDIEEKYGKPRSRLESSDDEEEEEEES